MWVRLWLTKPVAKLYSFFGRKSHLTICIILGGIRHLVWDNQPYFLTTTDKDNKHMVYAVESMS